MVFGPGAAQVVLTAIAITLVALALDTEIGGAAIISLVLTLSSSAFVLQMLTDKKQLTT